MIKVAAEEENGPETILYSRVALPAQDLQTVMCRRKKIVSGISYYHLVSESLLEQLDQCIESCHRFKREFQTSNLLF